MLTWAAFVEDFDKLADAGTGIDAEQRGRRAELTLTFSATGVYHHLVTVRDSSYKRSPTYSDKQDSSHTAVQLSEMTDCRRQERQSGTHSECFLYHFVHCQPAVCREKESPEMTHRLLRKKLRTLK